MASKVITQFSIRFGNLEEEAARRCFAKVSEDCKFLAVNGIRLLEPNSKTLGQDSWIVQLEIQHVPDSYDLVSKTVSACKPIGYGVLEVNPVGEIV